MKIHFYDELPSTNLFLNELIRQDECSEGDCVAVDFQTSGRGQSGNYWESEKGKNLTFSLLLCPDFLAPTSQFEISQLVSVAIKQVLDEYVDSISIKWPNDIYWNDKKIAGILIENSIMGHFLETSIVGIGLNVNQEHFVSDAPNPISLKLILGVDEDRQNLLEELISAILENYERLKSKGSEWLRKAYFEALYRKEGYFEFSDENGRFFARIIDVHSDGRLILQTEAGDERAYYFKEVSFVQ